MPNEFMQYSDVFQGINKLPIEHNIILKDDYVPMIRQPCRVPFKIRDLVKEKLDQMEKLSLILNCLSHRTG